MQELRHALALHHKIYSHNAPDVSAALDTRIAKGANQ
jgi:hypothetical protein